MPENITYENRVILSTVKMEIQGMLRIFDQLVPYRDQVMNLLGAKLPKRWLVIDPETSEGFEVLLDDGDPVLLRLVNLKEKGVDVTSSHEKLHADWQNGARSTLTGLVKIHPRALESIFEIENTKTLFEEKNSPEMAQENFKRVLNNTLSPARLLKLLPSIQEAIEKKEIEVIVF